MHIFFLKKFRIPSFKNNTELYNMIRLFLNYFLNISRRRGSGSWIPVLCDRGRGRLWL